MAWFILWIIILIVILIVGCLCVRKNSFNAYSSWSAVGLVVVGIIFISIFSLSGSLFEKIGFEIENVVVNDYILFPVEDESSFLVVTQKNTNGSRWDIKFVYNETINGLHVNQKVSLDISDFQVVMDNDVEPRVVVTKRRWKNSSVGFWFASCPNAGNHYTFYIPDDSVKYHIDYINFSDNGGSDNEKRRED